jgi:osmotically-inducible protein OsmY
VKKTIQTLIACVWAASALTACVPLAPFLIGSAAVGGVMVATDRRTSGAQLEDEGIELRAAARLRDTFAERAHINVSSYNRQVLLTGEVATAADKTKAAQIAAEIENVKTVANELAVLGNTTFSMRTSDSVVTGRVKAALLDDQEVHANAFKIVTERGTVYMMGRVTRPEADRATEVVRRQNGVLKVVRILEYISDEEYKRLQPPTPAPVQTGPTPVLSGAGVPWNAQPSGTK